MTSPVTNKNFKIGPLGDFEKTYVLYVAMAEKPLLKSGFVFYEKSRESRYLGNDTSDHRNENTLQYKVPPKAWENSTQNHFWPTESGFSAIATYKTYVFSKSPRCPIFNFFVVTLYMIWHQCQLRSIFFRFAPFKSGVILIIITEILHPQNLKMIWTPHQHPQLYPHQV